MPTTTPKTVTIEARVSVVVEAQNVAGQEAQVDAFLLAATDDLRAATFTSLDTAGLNPDTVDVDLSTTSGCSTL